MSMIALYEGLLLVLEASHYLSYIGVCLRIFASLYTVNAYLVELLGNSVSTLDSLHFLVTHLFQACEHRQFH